MKNKIEELFKLAGYEDYKKLEIGKFYKPKRKIEIASFENGKKVFKAVNAIVYKGMCKNGFLLSKSSTDKFRVTPLHRVYDLSKKDFIEVGKIWEEKVSLTDETVQNVHFDGLDENGKQVKILITKCDEEFPVLDLEVDNTHTYFSQGILSHNTFGSSAKASGTVIKRMNYFVDRYSTPVIWISQERANMCVSKNTIVDYKRLNTSKVQSTIKELFKTEFDLDMEEMEPLKVYNVEEANIGILAYDESKGENVYSKIISCIKKPLTAATSIKIEGRTSFEEAVSDNHMYAVYIEDSKAIDYAYARDLKKGCQVFTLNGFKKIVDIQKREKEDWFDIQTETGNYYANGILSHNSPMSHLNAITGGMAVNFYPSTRFRVSAREPITRNGEMVGIKIKIKNYKNKTGIPNRECLLDLYFHDGPDYKAGIDGESQYLDMALELGLVTQHGAWYYYRENDPNPENLVKCQGWGGLQTWFKENKDEFEKIKVEINAKMSCYDENLDKNSVEIDEVEAIKQEAIETAKRKAVNTEKLAEEAMQNSEEGSSEVTVENTVE